MSSIQKFDHERPAFTGKRPMIEGGRVVRMETFSVPPMPADAVEAIFAKFGLRYTKRWAEEIAEISRDDLREEWRRELAGFDLKAVRWALDNLPDARPPTVGEFRVLCRGWPGRPRDEDDKPHPRHRIPSEIAEHLRSIVRKNAEHVREQQEAARAERNGGSVGPMPLPSKPIPASALPPGMRADIGRMGDGGIRYWDSRS